MFGVYLFVTHGMAVSHAEAEQRGAGLLAAERWLHLAAEEPLNRALAGHRILELICAWEYATTYVVTTFGLLGLMWWRRDPAYRWARDTLAISTVVAIACFALWPTAPPRLLPNEGFVDIVAIHHPPFSWGSGTVDSGANQYAAMPSLHVGWAVWMVAAAMRAGRFGARARVICALHLTVTVLVVLATANHYLFDVIAGAVVVAMAMPIADWRERRADPARQRAAGAPGVLGWPALPAAAGGGGTGLADGAGLADTTTATTVKPGSSALLGYTGTATPTRTRPRQPGRARPPSTRPPRSRQPARRAGRGATRAPAAGSDTARTAPVVPAEPPSSRPVRIPAPDEFFLQVETATNLQHVGGVAVLDVASAGPIDLDRLREHLAARLPALARMNRLLAARGRVRHGRWRPAGAVDLSWHVQEVHLPAPADGDTAADPRDRSALERVVGELMALPMDRDRPLWRMWLVHGVGPGLAAVVVIVHHAIGDGLGVVALLRELLDEPEALPADTGSAVLGRPLAPSALPAGPGTATAATPPPPAAAGPADPADPVDPAGVPDVAPELPVPAAIPRQPGRLIRAGLVISGVAALARDGRAPRLALSGPLSTARAYRTRQWPLTTLQGVARTLGVRVTDVLLAVIGEGVRAVLGASAEQAGPGGGARSRPAVLRAAVPITLRHPAAADELSGPGNLTAGLRLDVPLGDMTVLERVRLVAAEAERRRRSGRLPASAAVIRLLGILPAGLHARATQAIYQGRYFTAIVSNMRGADSELCLLGRPLVDVYPLLPLAQGVTVSAGSLGWDGRYCLSFTVDPAWVDPDLLVAAVEDAVERLLAQVGPTTTTASP